MMENRKNIIVGILSLFFTTLLLFIIGFMFSRTYRPDFALIKTIQAQSVITSFSPEPMENRLFMLTVFLFPIILYAFIWAFKKVVDRARPSVLDVLYRLIGGLLAIAVLSGLSMINKLHMPGSISERIDLLYLAKHPLLYLVGYCLIVWLIFYLARRENSLASKIMGILSLALSLIAIFIVFAMNIFGYRFWYARDYLFDSVFYPVAQVHAGKVILANLLNQYGLYPQFIEPIFKLFGLSVLNFTVVMAALLAISYLFINLFIWQTVKNKAVGFFGFINIMYLGYIFSKLATNEHYFQYHPIRFFFPCIFIFMAAAYIRTRDKTLYYFSFLLYSIAFLWNSDSGIVVFLSWLLTLIYLELKEPRLAIKRSLTHILTGAGILLAVLSAYCLAIKLFYGVYPDLFRMFEYQRYFYLAGFYMVPMPSLHPWLLVVLIYAIGLVYSITPLIKREAGDAPSIVFMLSVLGTGLFSYYQGRSTDWNLINVSFPALILMVIYSDRLVARIVEQKEQRGISMLGFLVIFFVIPSSFFSLIDKGGALAKYMNERLKTLIDTKSVIARDIGFIKKHTYPSERIIILARTTGVYYAETGTASFLDLPFEIYLKKDYRSLLQALKHNMKIKVFYINNLPYFTEEEFRTSLWVAKLCRAIEQDHYPLVLLSKGFGSERLNEILASDFYLLYEQRRRLAVLSPEIIALQSDLKNGRRHARTDEVALLNRILLEKLYPEICPAGLYYYDPNVSLVLNNSYKLSAQSPTGNVMLYMRK